MADVDKLLIKVEADSSNAKNTIDVMIGSLSRLSNILSGSASASMRLKELAAGLNAVGRVKPANIGGAVKQIERVTMALNTMVVPKGKLERLVEGLNLLGNVGKSKIGATLNQLERVPKIILELEKADMDKFTAQIQKLTAAVAPLAAEMEKINLGFSKFPARIQKAIMATGQSTGAIGSKNSALSFGMMAGKAMMAYYAVSRLGRAIGGFIHESNDYVENLNLFTVSMGEFADEAVEFANKVSDAMGIDPSQWIRAQGIFMILATGFGVAGDQAALMSKNLTQLAYDISAFFNLEVDLAIQKLASGVAGELEPLRRIGWDLSIARLQTEAYRLGIDRQVSTMTQAEKVQLRYYAIMTQVTEVQGDMARTLIAPANQLRIFQAQLTQLSRAIGNIFIPALNATLPYLIAFLKVLRMVANEIANMFGFTLPEIDYSSVNNLGTAGLDAADGLDAATDAAKALKSATLGIDELNVIAPPEAGGAGSAGDLGGIGGLDIPVQSYDFLAGLTESRVGEIVKQIEGPIRRVLEYAGALAKIFAVWWAAKTVWGWALLFTNGAFLATIAGVAAAIGLIVLAVKELSKSSIPKIDIFGGVSGETKSKIEPILNGLKSAEIEIKKMDFGNKIITETDVENVANKMKRVEEIIVSTLDAERNAKLAKLGADKWLFTDAQFAEIQYGINFHFDKQIASTRKAMETINLIIAKASAEGRALTTEEYQIIRDNFGKIKNDSILSLTKTLEESESIFAAMKENASRESAEQALAILTAARDTRDGAILAANEQYQSVRDAALMMLETGAITEDEYNAMVNSAKNTKDETIKMANQQYEGILASAKKNLGPLVEFIDMETLKIKTIWEQTLTYMGNLWNTLWIDMVNGVARALNQIKVVINKIIEAIESFINMLADGFNDTKVSDKLDIKLPTIKFGRLALNFSDDLDLGGSFGGRAYANGGFPEDGMFFANSRELVGQFSNGKTAVANNDQITEGIATAVYNAFVSAMSNQPEAEQSIVIEIDGNEVGRSVNKWQKNRGAAITRGAYANVY